MPTTTELLKEKLNDPSLFKSHCFINDEWIDAVSGDVQPTFDPSSGAELAQVPQCGRQETHAAIAAASKAQPGWGSTTPWARANVLRAWQRLMQQHQEDLALILTTEQGKPLAESRAEVQIASDYIGWFAEEAVRAYGQTLPSPWTTARLHTINQPVGVCAAITPWNFPSSMVARKVAPALAAGCSIVLKPAERTPHSAFALAELAHRAGVPAGVFNVVTGDARAIGEELCSNELVAKLTFTGSTEVGRILMRQVSPTVKRVSFELGGNAPFIVFDDADVDAAVEGLINSKYRNAGQTCVCANRIFVQDGIYEEFAAKLTQRVAAFQVGPGTNPITEIGPLIDEDAVSKVSGLVADAIKQGARLLTGGKRHSLGGTYFEPTILADATPDMRVFNEEIFGPISPLIRFRTENEVVALANDSELGLASYFFTRDISRANRVAESLAAGMVGINTGVITTVCAPFGGVKQSGIGREGGSHGLAEYLECKYICVGGI